MSNFEIILIVLAVGLVWLTWSLCVSARQGDEMEERGRE